MNLVDSQLEPLPDASTTAEDLKLWLNRERAALAEAEADLAQEQAAVNAFRMHARLKLDDLVDRLLELRSEKEALLVKLEFLRQGVDLADYLEEGDPLSGAAWPGANAEEDEPLLPTPTPLDKAAEKRLYRELARRFHPDLATSAFERAYRTTIMSAVNNAYADKNVEALYDLAGELSPADADYFARITNSEARRMQQSIVKMRRLKRRARRQLQTLREENTAKLWRRAEMLEESDEDGWSLVRSELQGVINRREAEIATILWQIERLEQSNQQGE